MKVSSNTWKKSTKISVGFSIKGEANGIFPEMEYWALGEGKLVIFGTGGGGVCARGECVMSLIVDGFVPVGLY
jgi:hypothetical protein